MGAINKELRAPSRRLSNGYYAPGDADFVLIVTAESMEDYEVFTRKFFYEDPDIKGFKTMVVMDRVKTGFSVPIDFDHFS